MVTVQVLLLVLNLSDPQKPAAPGPVDSPSRPTASILVNSRADLSTDEHGPLQLAR